MKSNKILWMAAMAMASVGAGALTSCEDMLDPDSSLVMYENDNKLNTANDTLYSVIGVVKQMQLVLDRVNLLGELRGDLLQVTEHATTDIREIAEFTAGTNNAYNRPEDYYAIVNSCNYFINTADVSYSKRGQKIFEREMAAMKCFRAWTYMQLCQIYGAVPFTTDFIASTNDAEQLMMQPKKTIEEIAPILIADLEPLVDVPTLDYGSIGGYASSKFMIPARILLGDLCLWSGRYTESAMYYHDYLTKLRDTKPVTVSRNSGCNMWRLDEVPPTSISVGYNTLKSPLYTGREAICYIPMENSKADGTISYLDRVYNSVKENDYYYQVEPSNAQVVLSAKQSYCYIYEDKTLNQSDTLYIPTDTLFQSKYMYGDLRLYRAVTLGTYSSDNDTYSKKHQTVDKLSDIKAITLYSLDEIYLRYAEALNRAGFPSIAFAVLKYGLYYKYLTPEYVNAQELDEAGNLVSFARLNFTADNTYGMHRRGSGDVDADSLYVLPQPQQELASHADTVAYQIPLVEQYIADEMALETFYEGYRFGDLLRIAKHRTDGNAWMAHHLALRFAYQGQERDQVNPATWTYDEGVYQTKYQELQNPQKWYLPLPE